jgi:hypothetical protein
MNYLTDLSTPLSTLNDPSPSYLVDPLQLSDPQSPLSRYARHSSSSSSSELDAQTNQAIERNQFQYHGKENTEYVLGDSVDWREYNNQSRRTFDHPTDDQQELISFYDGFDVQAGWEANYGTQYHGDSEILPGLHVTTNASFDADARLQAYARGAYSASLSSSDFRGQIQAEAGASAEASVSGQLDSTVNWLDLIRTGGNANGHASALAGSKASGNALAGLGADGIYGAMDGQAFAGIKAEANGDLGFSINGEQVAEIRGGAEAQLGIGASATYELGLKDGKLRFKLGAGIALGIGLKFNIEGSINVEFFTDAVSDIIDLGGDLITDPIGSISSVAEGVWDAGTSIANGLYSLGTDVAEVLWDNGSQIISDGVEQVGELLSDGVEFAGDVVDSIVEAPEAAVEFVGEVISGGSELVADGAGAVMSTVGQGAEAVVEFAGDVVDVGKAVVKAIKFW